MAVRSAPRTDSRASARFVREVPWYGSGVWLKADTHTHTRFSDGARTVDEVLNRAAVYGCDIVAITDHTDLNLQAATPEYYDAIEKARGKRPNMIVFAGVEWNIPPENGQEHVTIFVTPELEKQLTEFKERFDDLNRSARTGRRPLKLSDGWPRMRPPQTVLRRSACMNTRVEPTPAAWKTSRT